MEYIDLTRTFVNNMPDHPGDPPLELRAVASIEKQGYLDHQVKSSMHVGTHIDAPAHMLRNGKFLNEMPLEKFFGRGVLIDARGKASINADLLANKKIETGDIVLVFTGFDKKFGGKGYYEKYPEFIIGFTEEIIKLGVSIVGMDTPGPDYPPYEVHKLFFEKEILIIENLTNLEALLPYQNFEIIALPAKFAAEAAPCRVVARVSLL